jgi:hypothetical protein
MLFGVLALFGLSTALLLQCSHKKKAPKKKGRSAKAKHGGKRANSKKGSRSIQHSTEMTNSGMDDTQSINTVSPARIRRSKAKKSANQQQAVARPNYNGATVPAQTQQAESNKPASQASIQEVAVPKHEKNEVDNRSNHAEIATHPKQEEKATSTPLKQIQHALNSALQSSGNNVYAIQEHEDVGNKVSKTDEPQQFLRIQRRKLPNGFIKLELQYVSYKTSEIVPTDEEIAAAALFALNQALRESLSNPKA